ncbi:MAG: hypothetical protein ABSH34_12340 [Verrucomicrobiota bacterium]
MWKSGDERLWQREVGNAMPALAMAWLLSGDRKCYADLGEEAGRSPKVVRALAEKEGWTFSAGGRKVTLDWATGEARVVHEDAATPSTGGEGTGVSQPAP